ncbi:MAG: histidine kinase [Bacteroidaceae bacterium]|nr:histidine kinase [Bacteroidaceae bacterium]
MKENMLFKKTWMLALLMTLFISYPNLAWLSCDMNYIFGVVPYHFYVFAVFRFCYFGAVMYLLLNYNRKKLLNATLAQRIIPNVGFAALAFAIYKLVCYLLDMPYDIFLMIPTFQFVIVAMMSITLGYMQHLYTSREKKEDELQQLKIESLQSRCNALINQINPHFFFNSLNGITSLVRRKDEEATIDYISQLSDIFRYILQSESKGLVPLELELDFAESYSKVLEVRFANKMQFEVDVPEQYQQRRLPVMALLPLLENVTVHNMIDSDHLMIVRIGMTEAGELVVSNPTYPKIFKPETHGTGLANLQKRARLLMDKDIRVESDDAEFKVIIPLV